MRSKFDGSVSQREVHNLFRRQLATESLLVRPEDEARHAGVRYARFECLQRGILLSLSAFCLHQEGHQLHQFFTLSIGRHDGQHALFRNALSSARPVSGMSGRPLCNS